MKKGTLTLDNETYQVKQICAYPETDHDYLDDMADDSVFMIVPDREALGQIFTELKQNWDEERVSLQIKYNMAFDIDGTAEEKVAAENTLHAAITAYNDGHPSDDAKDSYSRTYVECRAQNRDEYYSLNGGLLFIGLFLGAMFLMVTVLIIFYKQISEGYEDKERYAIMEKGRHEQCRGKAEYPYTDPDGIFPADRGSSTSCCHGIPDDQMDSGGVQPQQYRTVCLMRCGYGIGVPADLSAGVCADFPQLL